VIRATGALDVLIDLYDLSDEHRALIAASVYRSHTCAATLDESRSFQRVRNPPGQG
jgi:hypothetical protein